MVEIDSRIDYILISEDEIKNGVNRMAEWINTNYKNKKPIIIGILKGCIPLIGQLSTQIKVDCQFDYMTVSSFKGETKAQSQPQIISDLLFDISGRDIILVEDIIDTGSTIKQICEILLSRNPNSLKVITLLDKKEGRKVELDADFSAFTIPLVFIVGFGLDYKEYLRNLPYIGVLKPDVYTQDAQKIILNEDNDEQIR